MPRTDDDFEDDDRPRRPRRRDDDLESDRPRRPRRDDRDDRPPPPPAGKSKLPLILGLVAGVLLLLCGGGAYGIYYIITTLKAKVTEASDTAKAKVTDANDRFNVSNNLKQIGMGMQNYSVGANGFPTNSFDVNGKPLLSWRVHILPQLGEQGLYNQFRLDEPWDSPANRVLLSRMPKAYGTADEYLARVPMGTKTYYRGFSMPGAVMEPKTGNPLGKINFPGQPAPKPRGPNVVDIKDGLSNTFMVVEAGEAVEWTKPDDLSWAVGQPVPAFGGARTKSDVFIALYGDGSVRAVKKTIDPNQLKGVVTYAGNEIVILD